MGANIVVTDEYEEMAAEYQCIEISRLNKILGSFGIPEEQRKLICGEYFFHAGNFLDSGKLAVNKQVLFPQMHFVQRQNDELGAEITNVFVTSTNFQWHEYAYGDLDHVFEEGYIQPEAD
ncbi:MAG TPA: hypothetical protein VFW40_10190 [Capsulimonadaceae bacterium]|nr:hypothetical protein [Capsulimonadaceae bacterium]